eukprot:GFKZ01013789.1.p1 GENE.GFKZ01013789.1~~GFKZ01013789.1.p1  ORF type:complete len:122 (+),score=2.11 GFKZ01013789.1:214-579(+)
MLRDGELWRRASSWQAWALDVRWQLVTNSFLRSSACDSHWKRRMIVRRMVSALQVYIYPIVDERDVGQSEVWRHRAPSHGVKKMFLHIVPVFKTRVRQGRYTKVAQHHHHVESLVNVSTLS